jgi:ParB family chromosome partitioning protein
MQNVISVSPHRCKMWDLHDRLEDHVTEATCRAEIDSFTKHGQLIPVLGRSLQGHPQFNVELIYGARRLFVARHLNLPLAVDLRDLSDRDAMIAMDIENRVRQDISPYERAVSYLQWLRSGHFQSQDDIARALRVSPSQISRLLKLAQLPSVVIQSFGNPLEIREGWGIKLSSMLEDSDQRPAVLAKARSIIAEVGTCSASEVYRQLLAASPRGRKVSVLSHDGVVRADDGSTLFRLRQQRESISVVLPLERVAAGTMHKICSAVSLILQSATSQAVDYGGNQKLKRMDANTLDS